MRSQEMVTSKALELHQQAVVVIAHDHTMFGLAARRRDGESAVFSSHYAPLLRQGGVNVIGLVAGGDAPLLGHPRKDELLKGDAPRWWGSLSLLGMLLQEAEESSDTLAICLNSRDIDAAVAEEKVAALVTIEGGKLLSEGAFPESLTNLRTLYRLGVRGVQLLGESRSPLASATDEAETSQGLTPFGADVVREMDRLGMVIDVAHMPHGDPMFREVIKTSQNPVIDSHSNVQAACDTRRNLSDEQIKAIARKGGVIGMNFGAVWVNVDRGQATADDLVRHIDHIAELVGIDHVGLGPDFVDLEVAGLEDGTFVVNGIAQLPRLTEALVRRGYSDADVHKVLGQNFLRVYREVMG